MKPIRATIIALLCISLTAEAQLLQNPNSLIRIKIAVPASPAQRVELITLLELDHFHEQNGFIEAEVCQRDLNKLNHSRYAGGYEVLVQDVAAKLEEINRPYFEGRRNGTINMDGSPADAAGRAAFEQPGGLLSNIIVTPSAFKVWASPDPAPYFGGYYTYAQMVTAIENLYNTYSPSGLVDTFHLGLSIEGRQIYAVKISDNAGTDEANEPEVFFQGIQHAREAIGGSSMIFMMQYLCERYSVDTRIQNLVNNREIYIVVCMNPDGWQHNFTLNSAGGGGWRKNRRDIVSSPEFGVDLNRNWSTDWGNCVTIPSSCASDDPVDDTYYGTGPFSEPETQAIRNFIRSKHIVVGNDQHSVGPYYSLPFGRPTLHTGADTLTIMQQQWYTAIPALMGKYNGMRAGNSFQALGYEVAGGVKDWMLKGDVGPGINGGEKYNILGMTGEGGYGTGASTFWPAATSIITLCKGMTYQNLQMIYSAGSYVDIQDMTDIAVTATSGNFSFKVKRLGVENQNVTVSLVPLINVSSVGTPVVVSSLTNYYDTHTGNISYSLPAGITNGQQVRFAWKVETAGYTYSDTIAKFYNPTTLFSDNMETGVVGTNWTVTASTWNYVADSGFAATRALTESPGGSYPASVATRTARITSPINLTGTTAAYLTFLTKHRAENFHDKLQVQVATATGGPWTAIAGKTTVREPGTNEGSTINGQPSLTGIQPDWVKEEFNLASMLGNATVYIRFAFTSDASSSFYAAQDGGFYIDDLKVISTNTPLMTLGSNFLSFTGKLLTNNTIELKWDATVDNDHRYFEVEKSADRINFIPIGRIEGSMLYNLIDNNPLRGNNFYRIKETDVNGKSSYSNIINIVYSPAVHFVQLYPNPVKDNLTVRIKLNTAEKVSIQINDLSGRIIRTIDVNASSSIREFQIDTKDLSSNLYILKVINSNNEVIDVQKFVKQ
jgi:carboxypeptidase T